MKKFILTMAGITTALAMGTLGYLIVDRDNQISDLQSKNELLLSQQTKLENDISTLIGQKTSIEKQRDDYISLFEMEVLKCNALKSEKEILTSNINDLYTQINTLNLELEELRANQGNDEEIVELETTIANLQSQLEEKETQLETLNSTISQKETEMSNLNSQISNLQGQLAEKNLEIETLVNQLNAGNDLFKKVVSGEITQLKEEDFAGMTIIRPYAFYACTNLSSLSLPQSIISIGENAFGGCTSLTEIFIQGNGTPATITSTTFPATLTKVNLVEGMKGVYESADVWKELGVSFDDGTIDPGGDDNFGDFGDGWLDDGFNDFGN